jgi:hypothetical protein
MAWSAKSVVLINTSIFSSILGWSSLRVLGKKRNGQPAKSTSASWAALSSLFVANRYRSMLLAQDRLFEISMIPFPVG